MTYDRVPRLLIGKSRRDGTGRSFPHGKLTTYGNKLHRTD